MKSYAFLFWGYLAVWIGLAAYLGVLGGRLKRLAKRLDELESRRDGPKAT
jgi:CcmD family protein